MKKVLTILIFIYIMFLSQVFSVQNDYLNLIYENFEGFAEKTTGGQKEYLCIVTNLNDSGKGTLRKCLETHTPTWTIFNISGSIKLKSPIEPGSNKTIDGRGEKIIIEKYGINIINRENIIIKNIIFQNGYDDAIKIDLNSKNIWVSHCTLSDFTDGLIDITRGSTNITLSNNHFKNHEKTILIGADEKDTEDIVAKVTLYNNYFDSVSGRTPRLRYGQVHMFNNLIVNWDFEAVTSQSLGEIVSENNVFIAGKNKLAIRADKNLPWDSKIGYAYDNSSLFLNYSYIDGKGIDFPLIFKPKNYYNYTLEKADMNLIEHIINNSGWQSQNISKLIIDKLDEKNKTINSEKPINLTTNNTIQNNSNTTEILAFFIILISILIFMIYIIKKK